MIETIKKEKSIEKAVREVVNLKYNNYISELKDRIIQEINENNVILLTAPTGGGKTKSVIDIMKLFDDRLNIILTPNVIQNKQNATKYGVQAFTGDDKKIHSKYISATYDKARALINNVKEYKYKFNLFIDECHLMVDASGYRYRAIKDIAELSELADKVIYMSATNDYMRDGVLKYDIELNIEPVEKRNNIAAAQILLLGPENSEGSLLHEIYEASKPDNGRKTVLFYDDIRKLQEYKSILLSKGFKDNQIAVINSKEKTDYDQEVYDNIISHYEIPEQTKIILTTSVLEVGTNIDTRNVNIFVYIPKANHLNLNKITQQVARFRVEAGETSNNILKICLPYREREDNRIKPFDKIKKDLRTKGEKIVDSFVDFINVNHDEDTKEEKNKIIKSMLAEPRRMNGILVDTSLGFIELDEENSIPVINEFKLQRRAKEIYESQFFYNIPEFKNKLESMLNVENWFDSVNIKNECFKEEFKAIEQASKDAKKEEQEGIKEICKQIKKDRAEDNFVNKVIDPEIESTEAIEDFYKALNDTNIPKLVRQADKMGIEPQDMVNSFIENGDSEAKNKNQFRKYKYIMLNNKFPVGEEIPSKGLDEEYVCCRKLFDDICKKQGKLSQSKKLSLLIEYIKHNVLKSSKYVIKGSKVYEYKKNSSGNEPKPLDRKNIDKLVMPTITSVYNVKVCSDGKEIISSLKK